MSVRSAWRARCRRTFTTVVVVPRIAAVSAVSCSSISRRTQDDPISVGQHRYRLSHHCPPSPCARTPRRSIHATQSSDGHRRDTTGSRSSMDSSGFRRRSRSFISAVLTTMRCSQVWSWARSSNVWIALNALMNASCTASCSILVGAEKSPRDGKQASAMCAQISLEGSLVAPLKSRDERGVVLGRERGHGHCRRGGGTECRWSSLMWPSQLICSATNAEHRKSTSARRLSIRRTRCRRDRRTSRRSDRAQRRARDRDR